MTDLPLIGDELQPHRFDLLGPLPTGTVVLEASAGTGKTFVIAGLAARFVAEGHARLDQLLLVTFGRAATDELRERVRERLVTLLHGLDGHAPVADLPTVSGAVREDALLRYLQTGSPAEVQQRRERLRTAVATFDSATITTTHGMCDLLLHNLGLAANRDPEAQLTEDATDLIEEVAADVYLRRYGFADPATGGVRAPSYPDVLRLAADIAGNPDVVLEPEESQNPVVEERVQLAARLRAALDRRRGMYRLMDFDDLLTVTAAALRNPRVGPLACERVRSRYEVVLVDEFQDTDPVQWDILRRVFHGHRTLVMVGDPKQAIYGFRGGDVETYLSATQEAAAQGVSPPAAPEAVREPVTSTVWGLTQNHRSDAGLVEGVSALLRNAALGDPRIRVRPIAAERAGSRLQGAGVAPVQLRWLSRETLGHRGSRPPAVGKVRQVVVDDVVAQVTRAIDGSRRLSATPAEAGQQPRRVRPGDIAILVRTNAQGELVRQALGLAGIPAVMHATSSVFSTRGAREWSTLLEAVERPRDTARVRAAALGVFGGWSAARLAAADDSAVEAWRAQLRRWARLLETRGVAALLEHLISGSGVQARALQGEGGERLLTDIRHVGQILHQASLDNHWGTVALAGWLSRQVRGAPGAATRARRLESDAEAVQVITVHRSKGLEFPIVMVPFGWDRYDKTGANVLRYHDAGQRRLHVGGPGDASHQRAENAARRDELGEELRLLYVALTRASSQVVAWWAPSTNTPTSAMHRLLFGSLDLSGQVPDKVVLPQDDDVRARLSTLQCRDGTGHELVEVAELGENQVTVDVLPPPAPAAEPLQVNRFQRSLDGGWRRTSYSGLTAAAHTSSTPSITTSEPDDAPDIDEPATPSPMAGLPAGPVVGTYVHAVLENADTTAPDLRQELVERSRQVGSASWALGLELSPEELADALLPVMHTPLGPFTRTQAGELTLSQVLPQDRLSELTFELPMAGGDFAGPGAGATISDIADLLERHLPASHPLVPYPQRLRAAGLGEQQLRGYLTGSIDSVLRITGDDGTPRYVVVDYKTNWLGQWDGQLLTARDYRQQALAAAMMDSHYPLQAILYCVALHRFLGWRQPSYDPGVHLAGTLYLFLRGMAGPQSPQENGWCSGVFGWQPRPSLVVELSTLLAAPEGRS